MWGAHCLKLWAKTQQGITLSTAEAELVAIVKGCTEAIGMGELIRDLGGVNQAKSFEVLTDASAAMGDHEARKGVGKTRHIDAGMLWTQQKV